MPLQITGRHITVTPTQKDHIAKKSERLMKLVTKVDELAVTMATERGQHQVEVNFRSGDVHAFAKCSDSDALAAIDETMDRIASQIDKAKKKRNGTKKNTTETVRRMPVPDSDAETV